MLTNPWRDLVTARTRENHPGFFEMEFRVEGENLTLKADGQDICHARENSIMEAGTIGVKTLDGNSLVSDHRGFRYWTREPRWKRA